MTSHSTHAPTNTPTHGRAPIPVSLARCSSYEPALVKDAIARLLEPLGGMGAFVSPGQRVLLKPNFLAPKPPEAAVTTHPEVVRAVALQVRGAGGELFLGDSPGLGSLSTLLRKTGVGAVVEELGIRVVPFATPRGVAVPEGGVYRSLELAAEALDFDAVINLPKLKTHGQMTLTLAVKNLFGTVVGLAKPAWHLRTGSEKGMAELLLDIWRAAPPALSILDGITAMEGNGPGSGDPRPVGLLAASPSALALDAAVGRLVGVGPERHPLVGAALARGIPDADLGNVVLTGPDPDFPAVKNFRLPGSAVRVDYSVPSWIAGPLRRSLTSYPVLDSTPCTLCRVCAETCPVSAITLNEEHRGGAVDRKVCISCFCCQELCPEGAIRPVPGRLLRVLKALGVA